MRGKITRLDIKVQYELSQSRNPHLSRLLWKLTTTTTTTTTMSVSEREKIQFCGQEKGQTFWNSNFRVILLRGLKDIVYQGALNRGHNSTVLESLGR